MGSAAEAKLRLGSHRRALQPVFAVRTQSMRCLQRLDASADRLISLEVGSQVVLLALLLLIVRASLLALPPAASSSNASARSTPPSSTLTTKNATSFATFRSNTRSASSRAARAASHVSSLSVVDLEAPLALERVAANRSSSGEIVLTIFNRGGAAFALNLAHNMRSKGLDFYVLIGNDADSCAAVHAVDSSVACVYSTYMKGDERLKRYRVDAEHGLAPFRLWWARFYYMTELVKRGLNVMYVDIDVSFRSSPYPYFHGPLNNHNLFIQRERRALPGLNIGIVYCQRCSEGSGAHFVLSESLRRRDEILNSEQPLRNEEGHIASGPKNVLWDQHIVNDAAETASAGFESKRRSMSLLYKPENRESWMRSQGYRSEAWRTGKLWKPESLRFGGKQTEFAWHALTGPRSNTTDSSLVGPPGWLFGGFSGIIADSIDQGWWSWWNHEPPPVVMGHMVGSINKVRGSCPISSFRGTPCHADYEICSLWFTCALPLHRLRK